MKSKSELVQYIAAELSVKGSQVSNVLALLEDGNTIPFIARYRKEMTGSLDEVEIRTISERWTYLDNLEKRKEEVLRIIEEQGKLTEELSREIIKAVKL